ncbi:unnamed protein product [Brachionus calyciflorus]|uniref:Uncharacterized protein n=1 Tax=Brachionus calyciflorus TaxID=104777 RepID=A0A813M9Z2_9BILA|nr:unnamed protein product [Brachionus calyciflorus]
MNEFNSKRTKIGIVFHHRLQELRPLLISNFKKIVENPMLNLELEEIQINNLEFKNKLMKFKAIFVIFDENLSNAFDESKENQNLEEKDLMYKKLGRIMYQEFIDYGKNIRFITFVVDNLKKEYLQETSGFFKYPWLLHEFEDNSKNRIEKIKKIFFKPLFINEDISFKSWINFYSSFFNI